METQGESPCVGKAMDSKETLIRIVLLMLLLYAAGCLAGLGRELQQTALAESALAARLEATERENLIMRQKLEDGWSTEEWEALAWQRLGLVKPGEIVFLFPQDAGE